MTSLAKVHWDSTARAHLDELEQLHRDARGAGPGRRWGTGQLNRILFIVLVAQFQSFARDLHDEAIEVHVAASNPRQANLLRQLFTQGRKLDVQNPHPAALGSDFGRLGFAFAPAHRAAGVEADLARLETLVRFRNAIAHGNDSEVSQLVAEGEIAPTLRSYRQYRRAMNRLVDTMDHVVASELAAVLQLPPPW